MASSTRCGCLDDTGSLLSIETVLQCQKMSDFLIALAYFSIPLELIYFVTCATIFPFRWVLLQFGLFIVLCGLTHLVSTFTYAPHSFLLVLTQTILKALTALVSIATAITLVTLLPQLLRLFVREGLLRQKTRELRHEVGLMKRQEEAGWHVRMLTREIRRSLDRHTILYTTLVELSKALLLDHCAIWMPSSSSSSPSSSLSTLILTHEMHRRDLTRRRDLSIPTSDPDVGEIVRTKGPVLLSRSSELISCPSESGPVAAIRMPLLKASSFKIGTPELLDAPYAILVLVLSSGRTWTPQELETVEVVADQVAIALSHAAVLEDSLMVREQLMERNAMLQQERRGAETANDARILFRDIMSREMASPIRLITVCLSALQLDGLKAEQLALVKAGLAVASLVGDVADPARLEVELRLRSFRLHAMIEEVTRLSKLLCSFRNVGFQCTSAEGIPDCVIGDEKRILQAVLYMVGYVLGSPYYDGGGAIALHLGRVGGSGGEWKSDLFDEDYTRLELRVGSADCVDGKETVGEGNEHGPYLAICKRLAQLLHGKLSITSAPKDSSQRNMKLLIRLQHQKAAGGAFRLRYADQEEAASTLLEGMRILLGDGDGFNRSISRKVLERKGCQITVASSWTQCVEALSAKKGNNRYHLLLLDLQLMEERVDISARIRKLRSQQTWLIIVALVKSCCKETRDRCAQMGIHGVVCTPIVLQEMIEELQRITQQLQAIPVTAR